MSRTWLFLSLLAAVFCQPISAAEQQITIQSPSDYEVFQRQDAKAGRVLVHGQLNGSARIVQLHWTGTPLQGRLPEGWQTIEAGSSGKFDAELPVPAGGWYALDVRLTDQGQILATARVDHIGIGEVFVVAGQSNSTNYGSERQHPKTGLVSSFDGTTWRLADDPQPGTKDRGQGGSFIPAFGEGLVERYHVPVGVACCGSGATSVRQWLMKGHKIDVRPTTDRAIKSVGPNQWECTGELYDGLLKRMAALGPRGFRAVLWHQGESDAGQAPDRQITGARYRELLEQIIRSSRKDAGWDVPWFVAQATYHSAADPANPEFRAAQMGVVDDGVAMLGPDTDALGAEYRSGVHFNPKGLTAHGKLWAQKVGAYLDIVLSSQSQHR